MKKIIFIFILLIAGIINVHALTDEEIEQIDSKNNISMPLMITKDGAKINVYNINDYKLEYQWKEITLDLYNNISTKLDEYNSLVKEANSYSTNNRPDSSDNKAVQNFNDRINKYKQDIADLNNAYLKLFPSYPEEWISADSDNKIYHPTNDFSGKRPYVLYVKVTDNLASKNLYKVAILKIDGDKAEVENQTNDIKNEENIKSNSNNISNPKTIDKNIFATIGLLMGLIIVIIIAFKKLKKIS